MFGSMTWNMLETIPTSRSSQELCQETKRINKSKQMQQVAPTFINEQSQISPSFTVQDTWLSKETFATHLALSAYCLLTKNISFPSFPSAFQELRWRTSGCNRHCCQARSPISKSLKWHRYRVYSCLRRPFLRPTASPPVLSKEQVGSSFVPLDIYSG